MIFGLERSFLKEADAARVRASAASEMRAKCLAAKEGETAYEENTKGVYVPADRRVRAACRAFRLRKPGGQTFRSPRAAASRAVRAAAGGVRGHGGDGGNRRALYRRGRPHAEAGQSGAGSVLCAVERAVCAVSGYRGEKADGRGHERGVFQNGLGRLRGRVRADG